MQIHAWFTKKIALDGSVISSRHFIIRIIPYMVIGHYDHVLHLFPFMFYLCQTAGVSLSLLGLFTSIFGKGSRDVLSRLTKEEIFKREYSHIFTFNVISEIHKLVMMSCWATGKTECTESWPWYKMTRQSVEDYLFDLS